MTTDIVLEYSDASGSAIGLFDCQPFADKKPEPPTLRPYQATALQKLFDSSARRQLFVSPTGSGKTVFFCAAVAEIINDPTQHVLIVVHRKELVDQIIATLRLFGIEPGVIMAGRKPNPSARVQVASIASFVSRFKDKDEAPYANWVFVDEAHHSPATTYRRIFAIYHTAKILGVTATPCRGDGRGLGSDFDEMHIVVTVKELIALDPPCLVKTRIFTKAIELKGIKIVAGDYDLKRLGQRMNTDELVGNAVVEYLAHASGRSAIVFAVDVAHAQHLANEFSRHGIPAACIHADTEKEERDSVRDRLRNGELKVVCNVGIYTEGFDAPDVGCVILCRPTKSLSLFLQMVGRGLRPAPGKDYLALIDHAGGIHAHGFIDDDREWTLDEDRKVSNVDAANRKPCDLVDCPGCGTMRKRGPTCDWCDWQPETFVAAADFKMREGFLVEVERDGDAYESQNDKITFYQELRGYAQERGHSSKSAAWRFKEKFGHFPKWEWNNYPTLIPTQATRNFAKSREIAYAKARESASWR